MSNQGGIQAALRLSTGKAIDYNGDWHAQFDLDGIPAGDFNGRMLQWINQTLGTSYADLPGAMQAFAVDQGFSNWSSMDTLTLGPVVASYFLMEDGASYLLLEDGTSKFRME